jgi:hypothetical protein
VHSLHERRNRAVESAGPHRPCDTFVAQLRLTFEKPFGSMLALVVMIFFFAHFEPAARRLS